MRKPSRFGILCLVTTLPLLLLAIHFQAGSQSFTASAYAASTKDTVDSAVTSGNIVDSPILSSRITGVYELKRFEGHKCSGAVTFRTDGTCFFDLTIVSMDEAEKGEPPYRIQLEGNYNVVNESIKLDFTKRGLEDNSYKDPSDSDAFPCSFKYRASGNQLTLISEETRTQDETDDEVQLQFFFEKVK
ncbi:hypothetical protein ACFL4G_06905 [Thermodesulfobacteriota bacterium]